MPKRLSIQHQSIHIKDYRFSGKGIHRLHLDNPGHGWLGITHHFVVRLGVTASYEIYNGLEVVEQ